MLSQIGNFHQITCFSLFGLLKSSEELVVVIMTKTVNLKLALLRSMNKRRNH